MREKITAVLRLAAGGFTPFLLALWDAEEREAVEAWRRGEDFAGAAGELERELSRSFGPGWHVVTANLGRTAIQVALDAMQLEKGSEVILPTFGCLGTVTPVLQAGLAPVFADVDESFNIRFESALEVLSDRTRAILVPHMSGAFCRDTDKICEFFRRKNIWVIEDAAQSQGLTVKGMPAGAFGDVGIFSAHGGKQILSPGGGWLVTKNEKLAQRVRAAGLEAEPRGEVDARLASFMNACCGGAAALGRRYAMNAALAKFARGGAGLPIDDGAMSFRPAAMSGIEARLAHLQLRKLDMFIAGRRENALEWARRLEGLRLGGARLPVMEDNVFTKFLLSFEGPGGAEYSARLRRLFLSRGVETEQSYRPLHLRAPLDVCRRAAMTGTDKRWAGAFALPARPNLTERDWLRIDSALSAARAL